MKKFFYLAVLITFFVINFFAETVQAKIETFEGSGSYPITDEKTHGEVKELAKKEAIRNALEKAGIAVYSQVQVENHVVTKDVIKITAGSILKILDDKYKFIPVDEDDGIGMYRATVTISIDTDELNARLNDFLKKESNEQSTLANTKRIAELEKQLAEKNSSQNKQQILNEIAEIDKDTLYAQKIEESWQAHNNKNFEKALKLFEEAINLNPNDYQGYFGRGTAYDSLKNYRQAISDFTQAIKLNPNFSMTYNNRGNAYYYLQNYTQAILDYNQVIKLKPNDAEAYINRGNTYKDLQNYDQAISDYNQAIKLNPNLADAYNGRGAAYFNLKNYSKAIEDYNQAIKLNSNFAMSYFNRGLAYYYLKNYRQAIENFNKAVELNSDYAKAYAGRAYCYQELGNNSQAEKDLAKARQLGFNG